MIDDGWVWSVGGMILTGGNWSTERETCHNATLSIINPTSRVPAVWRRRLTAWAMTPSNILLCYKFKVLSKTAQKLPRFCLWTPEDNTTSIWGKFHTLKMEVVFIFETLVYLHTATRRHFREDGVLLHIRFKSVYVFLTQWPVSLL